MSSLRLLVLVSALGWADEPGHIVLPGESRPARTRIEEARTRLAEKKWSEGLGLLQGVIDTCAGELVPLPDGRSVSARWLCHAEIAKLPAEVLTAYRKRADPLARRWLEQADEGDERTLSRIVDQAFCTTPGLVALDRLGDRAFERGDFDEAEQSWQLVAPLNLGEVKRLVYPDPSPEQVVRVQAKQLLARLFSGRPGWQDDLDAFRKNHTRSAGKLAGREGVYATILADLAGDLAASKATPEFGWSTFAGNPQRSRVASGPDRLLEHLARLGRHGVTWRFDLEQRRRIERLFPQPVAAPVDGARRMAFFPAVAGQFALVADSRYITAYDLRNGSVTEWFDAARTNRIEADAGLPAALDLRYSLTVAENLVFARLGSQTVRDIRPSPEKRQSGESLLVCLGLQPGTDGQRLRWQVRARDPGRKEFAIFEGAPLVHAGRVYIAATRFEGDHVVTAIHCYSAHPEDLRSPLLWKVDIADTRELLPAGAAAGDAEQASKVRTRHHLLTLAGSRVVYCSHSGVIAVVDALTGQRSWALRYPRQDTRTPDDEPDYRDLAPPIHALGRLYVAPSDCDKLYCLDPATGEVIWDRERLEAVHLLGIGSGRLIFTTYRNPREGQMQAGGLRAINARDGSDTEGWALPDDGGGLLAHGRGLLINDLVLWPTARQPYGVFAVRQTDGQQPDNPALLYRIPAGNLLCTDGILLVTDRQVLHAFVPAEQVPDEALQLGVGPRLELQRARAALGRNEFLPGVEHCDRARQLVEGNGHSARELRRQIQRERGELLASAIAQDAKGLSLVTEADDPHLWLPGLFRARPADVPVRNRLEKIITNPQLAAVPIFERSGLPQPAGVLARRVLGQPVQVQSTPTKLLKPDPPLPRREIDLAPEEHFLPLAGADETPCTLLLTTMAKTLNARSRLTGLPLWHCNPGFAPTWGARLSERILVGGPGGVGCLSASSGQLLWSLHLPLTSFHLCGSRLVCVRQRRWLLCLSASSGEVLWQRPAPSAHLELPSPAGEYGTTCPVRSDRILAQTYRKTSLLDLGNGKTLADYPTAPPPWRPEVLLPQAEDVLFSPEPDRLQLLDTVRGKILWSLPLGGKSLRPGQSLRVVPAGNDLLVVERLNLGTRLRLVRRLTGTAVWSRLTEEGDDWLVHEEMVFQTGKELVARTLADGKLLWRQPLPAGATWRLTLEGSTLLVHAGSTHAVSFRLRWVGGSLQWLASPSQGSPAWSVSCLDASTGRLLQRINLEPGQPVRQFVPDPAGVRWLIPVAWTDDTNQASPGPQVVADAGGLIVALSNRIKIVGKADLSSSK